MELVKRNLDGQAGNGRAQAGVHTAAKAQVAAWLAGDVVGVGVGVLALVAVAAAVGQAHKVAFLHGLAVQGHVFHQAAAEALGRGVEAQAFFDGVGQQLGVGHHRVAGIVERGHVVGKHHHEAAQAFHARHDQRGGGQQHFAVVQAVAVNFGQREVADQVVARLGPAQGNDLGGVVLHPVVGSNVLGAFGAGAGIALHHHHGVFAHFVFGHQRFVAHGQAQCGHQHLDGELGRHLFEVELVHAVQLAEHLFGHVANGLFQRQQVALHERVLDQAAQAVVLGWVGAAQRGTGTAGQFGHQVAAGAGIGWPVLPGGHDVGVARQHPHLGFGAPEAGLLVAQRFVVREGVGVYRRRVGVEAEHACLLLVCGMYFRCHGTRMHCTNTLAFGYF